MRNLSGERGETKGLPPSRVQGIQTLSLSGQRTFVRSLLALATPASRRWPRVHANPKPKRNYEMTTFYAQPYDISATGFYFEDKETFEKKITSIRNEYGDPVEEFEIQFIDGEMIDVQVCEALGLYQSNIVKVMELVEEWDKDQKRNVIIAVGECSYSFDVETDDPDGFDIDLYEMDSMKELAEQFVDDGFFGEIPTSIQFYIDYEAIARDLTCDYSETTIDGQRYIYRCQ